VPDNNIYHYTSQNALVEILKGRSGGPRRSLKLWATEALFLNDSRELLAGRDALVEEVTKYRDGLRDDPKFNLGGGGFHSLYVPVAEKIIESLNDIGARRPDHKGSSSRVSARAPRS
jgi:hypothetical protein